MAYAKYKRGSSKYGKSNRSFSKYGRSSGKYSKAYKPKGGRGKPRMRFARSNKATKVFGPSYGRGRNKSIPKSVFGITGKSHAELKYYDSQFDTNVAPVTTGIHAQAGVTMPVAGQVFLQTHGALSATTPAALRIKRGSGPSDRDGRRVTVKRLQLRGTVFLEPIQLPGASNENLQKASDVYRIIVGIDKQHNGLEVTATDILQGVHNGTALVTSVHSEYNLSSSQRFNILSDTVGDIAALTRDGTHITAARALPFTKDFNLNLPVEYATDDSEGKMISSNDVFVLVISQHGAAKLRLFSRVRYADM